VVVGVCLGNTAVSKRCGWRGLEQEVGMRVWVPREGYQRAANGGRPGLWAVCLAVPDSMRRTKSGCSAARLRLRLRVRLRFCVRRAGCVDRGRLSQPATGGMPGVCDGRCAMLSSFAVDRTEGGVAGV
jgi:hypothetical protein